MAMSRRMRPHVRYLVLDKALAVKCNVVVFWAWEGVLEEHRLLGMLALKPKRAREQTPKRKSYEDVLALDLLALLLGNEGCNALAGGIGLAKHDISKESAKRKSKRESTRT